MKRQRLWIVGALAMVVTVASYASAPAGHAHGKLYPAHTHVSADQALAGIPMEMTPQQLPAQFRTQLRSDVAKSRGVAILKQEGNDIHYTFAWFDLTSPVISAHFHKGPEGSVGARAYSICGVAGESPACPGGTSNSISGVWKNADTGGAGTGGIVIAFHTQVYPAPIGEIAVQIGPSADKLANKGR